MARTEVRAADEAERHPSSNASAADIQGLHVRMARAVDRAKPCHGNIAVISDGRPSYVFENVKTDATRRHHTLPS